MLLPPLGSKGRDTCSKARVFSLESGKWLHDAGIKPEPVGSAACYDPQHNLIWCFSQSTSSARSWVNLGIVPAHHARDAADLPHLPYSPEHVLSTPPYSQLDSATGLSAIQAIVLLLAHMDMLARQHPLYGDVAIVTRTRAPATFRPNFSLEPDTPLFELLRDVLTHALECATAIKDNSLSYVILACLRVLKVNLCEYICSRKPVKADGNFLISLIQISKKFSLRSL